MDTATPRILNVFSLTESATMAAQADLRGLRDVTLDGKVVGGATRGRQRYSSASQWRFYRDSDLKQHPAVFETKRALLAWVTRFVKMEG